ncbi:MAG TPA: hypothetical protein VIC28_17850 [Thermoanaerobaculia bacterium]|jgi:hypothetical protein
MALYAFNQSWDNDTPAQGEDETPPEVQPSQAGEPEEKPATEEKDLGREGDA